MKKTNTISSLIILSMIIGCLAADQMNQDYQIQPGDVLRITVLGEDELSRDVKVSHNGKINFPLLGEVDIRNQTVQEIIRNITMILDRYLVNPQISVFVTQFGAVYIYGKVNKPGAIELSKRITLVESLTMAGGLTDYANSKKIMVIRNINNKKNTIVIDINSIINGGKLENDLLLFPGDIIIVPERMI